MDGHASHVSFEFLSTAINLGIHIMILPSHTTHRLQPLDMGVSSPLSTAYMVYVNKQYVAGDGRMFMDKASFFKAFVHAWGESENVANILIDRCSLIKCLPFLHQDPSLHRRLTMKHITLLAHLLGRVDLSHMYKRSTAKRRHWLTQCINCCIASKSWMD